MASIVKASTADRKRTDYLLAQLTDPAYVDYWVDRYKQDFTAGNEDGRRLLAFDRLVRETGQYYANDPLIHQDCASSTRRRSGRTKRSVRRAAPPGRIPKRKVFLKKIGEPLVFGESPTVRQVKKLKRQK